MADSTIATLWKEEAALRVRARELRDVLSYAGVGARLADDALLGVFALNASGRVEAHQLKNVLGNWDCEGHGGKDIIALLRDVLIVVKRAEEIHAELRGEPKLEVAA